MSYEKELADKRYSPRRLLMLLLCVFAMTGLCLGPSRAAEDFPLASAGDTKAEMALEQESEDIGVGGTISLIFDKDAGIRGALASLAALYHRNIAPSPNVKGQLGFSRLFDVTFEEAMDAILGENFKYEQDGNLTKVYTAAEYKKIKEDPGRMVHRVFTLYYISAEEAGKLISPVLSSAGTIETSTAAEKGISTGGAGGGSGGGGDSMALQDMISIYDYPENIASAKEVVRAIDVRPKQVLVEATILSALLTEQTQFGIDLNLLGGVALEGTSSTEQVGTIEGTAELVTTATGPLGQVAAGVAGSALEVAGFAAVGGSGLRIGVRSGNITAFITALEGITDTTVLANPKILAVNKQEGSVLIGQKVGYRSQTTQTDGGSVTSKVEFLETGTRLVFRPFVGDDGYVRMDIYPKDSSATLNEQGIPNETTAELRTNIVVRDGQTIVIGGLFRDVVSSGRNQVPLLGDLPFVGALFRSTNDTSQREEVIILLTVHIIEKPEQAEGEARAADVSHKRYGARQGLQWISRARLAEDRYARAVQHYADANSLEALYELNTVLELRPNYLEALRLKERIIHETAPDEAARMERIMLEIIEREEAPNWRRR